MTAAAPSFSATQAPSGTLRLGPSQAEVILDCSGGAWFPALETLIVSDLHFEKGSHFARRGQFLPPYDTRVTLDAVERLMRLTRPKTVVSLGDAFHDVDAEARMQKEDAERLERLCSAADWLWVLGNHDPLPPARFCGQAEQVVELAGLVLCHDPAEHALWNVAGHLHPCAVAQKGGRGVRRSCFVSDGERLVMPAFGAFTGGLNVLDDAIRAAFPGPFQTYLCGKDRVYGVPSKSLRGDAPPPAWMR
ncbi:MAG: ligase-associated DNA damage response endonuclease PdeM [Pseudomonadota bacterium]